MPRVPAFVLWILDSIVWTLWFLGMEATWGRADTPIWAVGLGLVAYFLMEPIRLVLIERGVSRREGRRPLSFHAIAYRRVTLVSTPRGVELLRAAVQNLGISLVVLIAVGYVFGERVFHVFPAALPLLALSALGRALIREENGRPHHPRPRDYRKSTLN